MFVKDAQNANVTFHRADPKQQSQQQLGEVRKALRQEALSASLPRSRTDLNTHSSLAVFLASYSFSDYRRVRTLEPLFPSNVYFARWSVILHLLELLLIGTVGFFCLCTPQTRTSREWNQLCAINLDFS